MKILPHEHTVTQSVSFKAGFRCPNSGWKLRGQDCYKISPLRTTWPQGRAQCKRLNSQADLAIISDETEQDFINERKSVIIIHSKHCVNVQIAKLTSQFDLMNKGQFWHKIFTPTYSQRRLQ